MKYRRGSILILVLCSLAALGFLVVAVGKYVSESTSIARHLENSNRAYFLARAGVELAVTEIMDRPEYYKGTTIVNIISNDDLFKENKSVQGGIFSVSYTIDDRNTGKVVTNYGVLREAAKIDVTVNTLGTRRRLEKVIKQLGVSENIVDNILVNYPKQKKVDAVISNRFGSYEALPELLSVQGVSEDVFDELERLITFRKFKRLYNKDRESEWVRRDSYGGLSEGKAMVKTSDSHTKVVEICRISFIFDRTTTNFLSWREH